LDDNIHNLAHDSIACVQQQQQEELQQQPHEDDGDNGTTNGCTDTTVPGTHLRHYHEVHLIRVPTIEPVLNPQWFIQKLKQVVCNIFYQKHFF
jgi:hypothetical protein